MLGIFGTSAYKYTTDFQSHKDYLNYMYGEIQGFVSRSVISQKNKCFNETFNLSERLINHNSYYNVENCYTSMNSFLSPKKAGRTKSGRKVENLKRLNALYLDLDCYKIGLSQEQVLYELEREVFCRKIPLPTFVIDSGRGLYLIWKIDEDRNALPRWTRVQKFLYEKCKEYNADPQALDAARILRVPFTRNSKNGEQVRILQFNDVKYTLHDIIKEYGVESNYKKKHTNKTENTYPYGEATEKQRQIATWQANTFGVELPDFTNYQATYNFIKKWSKKDKSKKIKRDNIVIFSEKKAVKNMLDGRINDLFSLFKTRTGEDCNREYALFLCRLWAGERTNNMQYALEQTYALNRTFDVPFDENYVKTRTKSAETKLKTGKTYQYCINKIIDVLQITEEEQQNLQYLCKTNTDDKKQRQKTNRKAYLARLDKAGKTTKKDNIRERQENVAALLAKGKNKSEICFELNLSERTFDRDKAAIISNGLLSHAEIEEEKHSSNDTACCHYSKKVISPNFKSNYYRRTPVGCSARIGGCVYLPILSIHVRGFDSDDTGDSS